MPTITAASMVAWTINGSNLGLCKAICMGITMLRMIALKIIALSLCRRIANPVTSVIKVIGDTTWRFNLVANSIARVVINPVFRASVICAVVHVVWAIAHIAG